MKSTFFNNIESNVIEEIKSAGSKKTFEPEQMIFQKGSPADYLYILEHGCVELLLRHEEQLLFRLKEPGEVFGWSSLVEKGVYTSTSISKSPTLVLKISKKDIEMIFVRHPRAAIIFYQHLGSIFSKRILKQQSEKTS